MRKLPLLCTLVVLLLLPSIAVSQDIDISLKKVAELRTSAPEDRALNLTLSLSGIAPDWERCIRLSDGYALDEKGNRFAWIDQWSDDDYQYYQHVNLSLELPSRRVKQLQRLEVTFNLLTPSENESSLLKFKGFQEQLNKDLLAGHYKDIAFVPMDSLSLVTLDASQWSAEEVDRLRSYLPALPNTTSTPSPHSIHFLIFDPDGQILQINFYNGQGEKQTPRGPRWGLLSKSFYFPDTPIGADWSVELIIENEASVREYTLQLFDIGLP